MSCIVLFFFFFFSSRRRHTRFDCDWSSDVCSSDLGLAHYLIHANDSPRLAQLGLNAARRYAEIAPSAPHAQHMPSHIFIRLGLWDETIAANTRAFEAGLAYARAHNQPVAPERLHALDYMVYAYLQQGRDREARAIVDTAQHLATVTIASDALIANYNQIAMEARLPL